MTRCLLLLLAAALGAAHAKPVLVAGEGADSPTIELHDVPGPCVGQAHLAVYVPPRDQGERVPGCWTMRGSVVRIVWLDGDADAVPVAAFRAAPGV